MGVVKLSTAGILDYSKTSNFLSGNAPVSFGAFDLLETTTLTSSASSVTFSGLDAYSDYKHLQIRAVMRTATATTNMNNLALQFNGDTATNYNYHYLDGTGSAVNSGEASTQSVIRLRDCIPGDSNTAGLFGAAIVDLLDYKNTAKNKVVRALHGGTAVEQDIILSSGMWLNTVAVSSILLKDESGASLVTGTRFSLYGIKG